MQITQKYLDSCCDMSRFSRYDTDEERLPEGMTRVGYDADTQVYTFQDADGSYWESAPGCEYGQLTRVGDGHDEDAGDTEPFLVGESRPLPGKSWRTELMPLLNFGLIIGLSLLLLFWYLHWAAGSKEEVVLPSCADGGSPYVVKHDDTCWDIAQKSHITVEDILRANPAIDCDKLSIGSTLCLPDD